MKNLVWLIIMMFAVPVFSQTIPEQHACQLGITLSGGAARGYAHVGVLRAFE